MRGRNGEADGSGKGFEFHRSFFTWGSPVKSLLKNVFLDARGNKPMNGLAAMGALARFRGGDVAGNGFEEIHAGFAKMRDELRGGDRFALAFGVGAGHEVRRDDKLERFGADTRSSSDDEITETKERFVFLPHGDVEKGVGADHEEDAIAGTGMAKVADGVYGIVKLTAGEIVAGLGEGRYEVRMVRTSERDHGEAVRERREMLLEFVRRAARRDEMDFVEVEAAVSSSRDGEMAVVDWVKGTAKQRDAAGMKFCGSAVYLSGGQ